MSKQNRVVKQFLPAGTDWHVVYRGTGDYEGVYMLRVACWAVVREDGIERVVACYAGIESDEGAALIAGGEDENELGLSEPGDALSDLAFWQDHVEEMKKAEAREAEEHDAAKDAPKQLAAVNGLALVILGKIVAEGSTQGRNEGDFGSNADFMELARLGLIYPHMGSSTGLADWYPTTLGRAVAKLDHERG